MVRHMRTVLRLLTVVGTSLFIASSTMLVLPAAGTGASRCHDVIIRNSGGSVYTRTRGLFASHVRCSTARRVAYGYLVVDGEGPKRPLGYRCRSRSDGRGVTCSKGHGSVRWKY